MKPIFTSETLQHRILSFLICSITITILASEVVIIFVKWIAIILGRSQFTSPTLGICKLGVSTITFESTFRVQLDDLMIDVAVE